MARRRVLSRGMNLGRHEGLDYEAIKNESNDMVAKGNEINERGIKFESDKEKLEDTIDNVLNANIGAEDKRAMLAELDDALDKLQAQYEADVANEQARVQKEIMLQLEKMDQNIDELSELSSSMDDVKLDVAYMDTSSAAKEVDVLKQNFEQMKRDYTERLRNQVEQAEQQQRNIRARRISGR